jgi:hypothetical protein
MRTTGLAFLNTATSLSRLVSSILFGSLWSLGAMKTALSVFTVAILVSITLSAVVFVHERNTNGTEI